MKQKCLHCFAALWVVQVTHAPQTTRSSSTQVLEQHSSNIPPSVQKEMAEDLDDFMKGLPSVIDDATKAALDKAFSDRRKQLVQEVLAPCGGAVLVLFLLGLIVFLRFHRHKRGPGHCRSCGYSLHGLDNPRCPECGAPFEIGDSHPISGVVSENREVKGRNDVG